MGVASGDEGSSGDYEEVVVGANDSVTYTLGDNDTLENVLIDISADNAKFYIRANGSGWRVENVGIKGTWDDDTKEEPFIVNVTAGGTGIVKNFYWADGTAPFDSQRTYGGAATGCYVANSHAGTLIMENMNLQGFSDNGVYGSSPGDLPSHPSGGGGGGEVIIRDSYAADCAPAGFRLGSDGSRLENCVVTNCTRNFWGFYHDTEVVGCDLSNSSQFGDIVVSDSYWDHSATVTATDTYFETTNKHGSNGEVIGSSADRTPRTQPQEVDGVPLTPEEAASGTSLGSSSSPQPDGSDESDETDSDEGHLLAFVTESGASDVSYEFTAEGPVEFAAAPYDSPSGNGIEGLPSNDYVEETTDGNWSAGGTTGNGFGDAFRVEGPVTTIDVEQPDVMWIELDGEKMSPAEVVNATAEGSDDGQDDASDRPSHALVIDGTDSSGTTSYSFSVSGDVVKSERMDASIDEGDVIDGQSVSGTVANWRDAYWFSGDITDFWLSGDASIHLEYDARE